jgi:hypothetical protein
MACTELPVKATNSLPTELLFTVDCTDRCLGFIDSTLIVSENSRTIDPFPFMSISNDSIVGRVESAVKTDTGTDGILHSHTPKHIPWSGHCGRGVRALVGFPAISSTVPAFTAIYVVSFETPTVVIDFRVFRSSNEK